MICPCCRRPRPLDLPIIGIQTDINDAPALILWNCPCGTTRAVKWEAASDNERAEAMLKHYEKESPEMMVR